MKDNKIFKGNYIPFDIEEDEDEEILNAAYDYFRRFAIILDNNGNRVLNSRHIIMNKSQILINRSFFKGDLLLLKALEKLPKEGTAYVLRIMFDAIGIILGKKDPQVWDNMDYILVNDLDPVDVGLSPPVLRRKHHDKWNYGRDEFFQTLANQVKEIISGLNPNGRIRISSVIITKLGYYDMRSFDEEFLYKVYTEVAKTLGIELETVVEKMKDRIEIVR